ncbi:hypothetical protein FGX01_02385, partial [Xylella fastidiosa subsp. multiplex]|nr:hypothetical protein [Xylella fastidiosa subsp. multiplex]
KGPGNHFIEYQLYRPGTDTVITPGSPIDSIGMGSQQTVPVEGRINTRQADVPVGEYIDRPIMVIEY